MKTSDIAFLVVIGGFGLAIIAWLWGVVLAFGTSAGWGLLTLLFFPAALVYGLMHRARARIPLILFSIATIAYAVPLLIFEKGGQGSFMFTLLLGLVALIVAVLPPDEQQGQDHSSGDGTGHTSGLDLKTPPPKGGGFAGD